MAFSIADAQGLANLGTQLFGVIQDVRGKKPPVIIQAPPVPQPPPTAPVAPPVPAPAAQAPAMNKMVIVGLVAVVLLIALFIFMRR